nr:immunoglobulin-binding protein 1 [Mirounga angustirostris]
MATAEDELLLPRLPELFETSKQLLDEVEVATEPTGSRVIQEKVVKGLDLLKKAAEMLSQLELFSRNEDLEEIASTDLKYLMVPAFQGALTMKQVNPSKRLDHLQWAREHFLNYLIQCQYYHVAEFELPKAKDNSTDNTAGSSMAYPSLADMASQRQAKIERWVNSYNLRTAQWQCCWGGVHVLGGREGNSDVCHSFDSLSFSPLLSHFSTAAELKRSTQQQEDQEQKEEDEDDEQTLRRAREWDDWKDTHPRGYGNRQNMG